MKLKISKTILKINKPSKKRVIKNQKVESVQIQKKKITEVVFV